jgi:hypothetical protein
LASRYQQVTDPEEAWKYYEAGLLYRKLDSISSLFGSGASPEFLYLNESEYDFEQGYDARKARITITTYLGKGCILVEEDEEQPIG